LNEFVVVIIRGFSPFLSLSLQLGKSILSSSKFWCCYIVPYLIWHSSVEEINK
jgi:hypothetical protein